MRVRVADLCGRQCLVHAVRGASIPTRKRGVPGWCASRRRDVHVCEEDPFLAQPLDVWRLELYRVTLPAAVLHDQHVMLRFPESRQRPKLRAGKGCNRVWSYIGSSGCQPKVVEIEIHRRLPQSMMVCVCVCVCVCSTGRVQVDTRAKWAAIQSTMRSVRAAPLGSRGCFDHRPTNRRLTVVPLYLLQT